MSYQRGPQQNRNPGGGRPPDNTRYDDRNTPRPEQSLDELWPGRYLADGYFTGDGNLRPEYVRRDTVANLSQAMSRAAPPLTGNQLRRFFGHCRAIEAALRSKNATWAEQSAAFQKLDIAAADAWGKQPPKVPRLFHDFIKRNVAAVRNEKDFLDGLLPHFEALVGFGSADFKNERN